MGDYVYPLQKRKRKTGQIISKCMNKKRGFFSFFLKFLLITIATLVVLLSICLVFFSFHYQEILKHFLGRELSIEKISFDIKHFAFDINNLSYRLPEGEELLAVDSARIDLDFFKTLSLRPTIQNMIIEHPQTYLIKKGNSYSLPPLLPEKNKRQIAFPFSITLNGIFIQNGTVTLRENGKSSPFLTDLSLTLPSIGTESKTIAPEISGKIHNKPFSFQGETIFGVEGEIINKFSVKIENLDLYTDRLILPVIPGISLERGVLQADATLEYTIYKNKTASFTISGALAAKNLKISSKQGTICENLNGEAVITKYDITKQEMYIDTLRFTGGRFQIPENIQGETVPKTKFFLKKLHTTKLDARFQDFTLTDLNSTIENIGTQTKETLFDLTASLDNGRITAKGKMDKFKTFFETITISHLDPYTSKLLPKQAEGMENLIINHLDGSGSITTDRKIIFSGTGDFSKIKYRTTTSSLSAEHLLFTVHHFDSQNKTIELQKLELKSASFSDPVRTFSDIHLSIGDGKTIHRVEFHDNLKLEDQYKINHFHFSAPGEYPFSFSLLNGNLDLKLQKNNQIFTAGGSFSADDISIYKDAVLQARVKNIRLLSDKITTEPLRLNFSHISSDYIYTKAEIDSNQNLLIAGIFPLLKKNQTPEKKKENDFIHIANLTIKDGDINFIDNHLQNKFYYDLTGIRLNLQNYPSFIYPKGQMELKGLIDTTNPFQLNLDLSKIETKGTFQCKDALLFRFSPYAQEYLKHKIYDGRISATVPFAITDDKIVTNVNFQFYRPALERISSAFPLNLNKTFQRMTDKNDTVNLHFTVNIERNKNKVHYFDAFFEVMKRTLQVASEKIADPLPELVSYDPVYSIAYFSGGKATLSGNNFISQKMLEKMDGQKTVFSVSGFVDKNNDTEYIKREIAERVLKKYAGTADTKKESLLSALTMEYQIETSPNMDTDFLYQTLLEQIQIGQEDFYGLARARTHAVIDVMVNKYQIPRNKIFITESDIFNNPFISGVPNNIAIIRIGTLSN